VILALTGATGFVGRRTLALALARGDRVRALTRRPQPVQDGVTWVEGALDRLNGLADGAEVLLHIAGVVNAPDRAGFAAGNIAGTKAVVAEATRTGARLLHVSSLAAREPDLSAYGWSKAEAERVVTGSPVPWTVLRPPGVYGPGDTEMLDVFRAARLGLVPVPPAGRASWIHVDDLARLLLDLAEAPPLRAAYEADDGEPLFHPELARRIGAAVGRRVLPLPLPGPLLSAAAALDRRLRGSAAKLTPDRARYLRHPDWTADPARRPPGWQPAIGTREGLKQTAAAYRAQGLL
jgi:nucleoside-diphosphate-sugar epimerase